MSYRSWRYIGLFNGKLRGGAKLTGGCFLSERSIQTYFFYYQAEQQLKKGFLCATGLVEVMLYFQFIKQKGQLIYALSFHAFINIELVRFLRISNNTQNQFLHFSKIQKLPMSVFSWLLQQKKEEPQFKLIPKISINPKSTLYIEVEPKDPSNCSNIVITAFASSQVRSIIPIRVEWSRFKVKAQAIHSVQRIHCLVGNTYMCQPSDVGGYIKGVVRSVDQSIKSQAEVTIGPIGIDVMLKRIIEGNLYSGSLQSKVVVCQKDKKNNVELRLNTRTMQFVDLMSHQKFVKDYSISEPKIELNPKDATRVYLRWEQDQTNQVRDWLNKIFQLQNKSLDESSMQMKIQLSNHSSSNSRIKLFQKSQGPCINKIQVRFISRNSRDLFLFTHKAFICREDMKNSLFLQRIQNLQNIVTQEDYHRFLSYMSLKNQIIRLADFAKELEDDRNTKIKDLVVMQQSIGEMTLTYLKIIEEKGKHEQIDFQHSYSQISIARQEIMNKKHLRELKAENQNLKQRLREMNEQLQLAKFFKKQDNQSMIFNQTSNPFSKKNNNLSVSYQYNDNSPQTNKAQRKNMYEMSVNYTKLLEENNQLKRQMMTKKRQANNLQHSQNMIDILGDLDEKEEKQAKLFQYQKRVTQYQTKVNYLVQENERLKKKIDELLQSNQGKYRLGGLSRSNRSISVQQNSQIINSLMNQSGSSVSDSFMNQSITSEMAMMKLEQNLKSLSGLNSRLQQDNTRLRRQRDYFRSEHAKLENQIKLSENKPLDRSNYFLQSSMIMKFKEENQVLQNEKKSLVKKLESLSKENVGNIREQFMQKQKKIKEYQALIDRLKLQNIGLAKQAQQKKQKNQGSQSFSAQNIKLRKINSELLQQIKTLKLQLQIRKDNLYNSRVIQMQNQIKVLKSTPSGSSFDNKKSLDQINELSKANAKLKQENQDKQIKIDHQTITIEKLMRESTKGQDSPAPKGTSSTSSTKQKAYSEKHNQATVQQLQKYKREVKKLQQEIIFIKKSSDAINRSRDLTLQMDEYCEQKMEIMKKQLEALYQQNQNLSKMCERYGKDAREANKQLNKWREKAMELMKAKTEESSLISNELSIL